MFASRRAPGITIAKLRAIGEVGELTTDDLRFDTDETARLFSESYGRTLEPDVLADVAARTEGGPRRSSSCTPRSAIGRPARSASSCEASPVPTASYTTTSPRRSSATCPPTSRPS